MVSVFFHSKESVESEWQNEEKMFTRVPVVGEYVTLSATGRPHRVYAVIHCPFNDTEYQAEVFTYPATESLGDVIRSEVPLAIKQPENIKDAMDVWRTLGSGNGGQ